MREQISVFFGICAGVCAYLFGGFDQIISVFITVLLIDTFAGVIKAWNLGQYKSEKFRKGLTHKISYLIGIILSTQIDILCGGGGILRDSVITFFIFNESMSIIENLGEMGIEFPEVFTNAIKSLRDKKTDDENE